MVNPRARSRGRRWARLSLGVAAAALMLLTQPTGAFGGPGVPGHSHVWGYEAAFGAARLLEYNIDPTTSTITPGPFCVPVPSGNGRAVAHDPNAPPQPPFAGGEVLWYQFFATPGTGRIFKATLPSALPPCQPRGSIPFGEGPGPPNQDNIGAMDLDTDDTNILWVAGYGAVPASGYPEFGGQYKILFKVDKTNGQILGRCKSDRGNIANDTLTVANLPTVGKVLLTDFFDPGNGILDAVDPASITGPPAPAPAPDCRIVATYTTPVLETGIEWGTIPKPTPAPPEESLLATDLFNWFDLDQPPFATARPMGSTAGALVEDISLVSEVAQACPPEDDDDDGDDDGRRDDDDDDDDDDDGLTDRNESLFLTLLGNRDSDLDGIVDGNDDSNGNDEDDEDEDDDECPDDDDSDGDGVDDEDEDDDDGDD
jgi:hypothetical protein